MVADNPQGHNPVLQGMRLMPKNGTTNGAGPDATSTGAAVGTFPKVGLDFVGPFKPPVMRTGNRCIIVASSR